MLSRIKARPNVSLRKTQGDQQVVSATKARQGKAAAAAAHIESTYVSRSVMSWYLDFSLCSTFFTFREKACPGHSSSLNSLNHPSAFMVGKILICVFWAIIPVLAAMNSMTRFVFRPLIRDGLIRDEEGEQIDQYMYVEPRLVNIPNYHRLCSPSLALRWGYTMA